jgi:hypothetical protein
MRAVTFGFFDGYYLLVSEWADIRVRHPLTAPDQISA